MNSKYFNAIALTIIILCFFIAGMVQAHEAVIIEVKGADETLDYACKGFVGSLVDQGKVLEELREASEEVCRELLVERLEPVHYQHDHG